MVYYLDLGLNSSNTKENCPISSMSLEGQEYQNHKINSTGTRI